MCAIVDDAEFAGIEETFALGEGGAGDFLETTTDTGTGFGGVDVGGVGGETGGYAVLEDLLDLAEEVGVALSEHSFHVYFWHFILFFFLLIFLFLFLIFIFIFLFLIQFMFLI
jgi:hypothetical protein